MYEVEVIEPRKILVLRFVGHVTFDIGIAARDEASALAREKGLQNVVIDLMQAEVAGTTMEFYEFVNSDMETWPQGTRYAFVFKPENWDPNDARFSENVAVNRGLDRRSFPSVEEAIAWLSASNAPRG
ncbi:MAG: hypothetical protein GY854_06225 [Deltaproteobacteria bacterium]|nr:hypothetical protein [Deltaproteobacteria bacterium]